LLAREGANSLIVIEGDEATVIAPATETIGIPVLSAAGAADDDEDEDDWRSKV